MSDAAHVIDVRTLEDLNSSTQQAAEQISQLLDSAGREIAATLEWLEQRRLHWLSEVDRRRKVLDRALVALAACRAIAAAAAARSAYSCDGPEMAVLRARVDLKTAEDEAEKATFWLRQIHQGAAHYQPHAQRLATFLHQDVPHGLAVLASAAETLRSYANLPTVRPSAFGAATDRTSAGPIPTEPNLDGMIMPAPQLSNKEIQPAIEVNPGPEHPFINPERKG
jgi:hypothetical protein